jgi:hypothetical protein
MGSGIAFMAVNVVIYSIMAWRERNVLGSGGVVSGGVVEW